MILLTGGAGFIGSATLAGLNQSGRTDTIVADNLRSSEKWKNLLGKSFIDYLPREKLIEQIRSNSFKPELEAIIHFGACSSTTEQNVDFLIENNFLYSRTLAEYALARNIRFIYASSAATYGAGERGFSDKCDLSSLRPLNAYGFSKYLFDLWLRDNHLLEKVVGLKFFNVFGPNEQYKGGMRSMVLKSFEQICASGKVRLFKSNSQALRDGEQTRDFIYVKDCVAVTQWLLAHPETKGIFNLGSGVARNWNDLAKAVFSALGKTVSIEYIDIPPELSRQYQNHTCAGMEKLREAGYQAAFTPLEEAISDYVKNYLVPAKSL